MSTLERCAELARKALGDDATVEILHGIGTVRGRDYFMQFFAATREQNIERIEKEMLLLPKRMVMEAQSGAVVLAASSPQGAHVIGLLLARIFAVLQDLNLGEFDGPAVHWREYRKMLRELDELIWKDWKPPFPCIPVIAPVWA